MLSEKVLLNSFMGNVSYSFVVWYKYFTRHCNELCAESPGNGGVYLPLFCRNQFQLIRLEVPVLLPEVPTGPAVGLVG